MFTRTIVRHRLHLIGLFCIAGLLLTSGAAQAETKTGTITNKPGSGATCTSAKIAKNNGGMTITAPAGATVKGPAAGSTGTWEVTGLNIPPGGTATFTFTNNNGTVNYRFISFDYKNAAGKTVWTGKCNDPIAFHVVTGGPGGDNYLGYPIPSGHYGYFYQMYPNPTNTTTVLQASIQLSPGSGAYNFQVLTSRFPYQASPGFDLEDILVPAKNPPDGYNYQVQVPYMDASQAVGLPGILTSWSFNPVTNTATMDFTGAGGLAMGQTGSLVAFTSPYPPTVTPDNVAVSYLGGVEPPCTGNFAPDALVPEVPDVPEFSYQALPELPGGASEAFGMGGVDDAQDIDIAFAVGRSLDFDSVWKAVAWSRTNGVSWDITTLPNPFGNTQGAVYTAAKVRQAVTNEMEEFSAGGSVNDALGRSRPVLWVRDQAGVWSVHSPPLPPGYDSGAFRDAVGVTDPPSRQMQFAGWVALGPNPHHAAYCEMENNGGGWTSTFTLLPDTGPTFPSDALCTTHDNIFIDDVHIGGAVGTPSSPAMPCIWQPLPGGGFERIDLSLTLGAYLGSIAAIDVHDDGEMYAAGHNASVAGLADLYRGVLYRKTGGVWGAPIALPPLPGMRDSRATSIAVIPDTTAGHRLFVGGLSYVELSTSSERATLWEVGPDNTIITYDVTQQTINIPPSLTLKSSLLRDRKSSVIPNTWAVAGHSEQDGLPGIPHAYVATSQPPSDPLKTVSPTQVVFGALDTPPIPADFFYPGSQPFFGSVQFRGGEVDPDNLAVSTMIQRGTEMHCPGAGFPRPCDPVPIEIVALQLVSINPIVVSGPSTSSWRVEVSLSDSPQPLGGMGVNLEHNNGGSYSCFLPVIPKFKFINMANPADIRFLDYAETGNPPVQLQFNGIPWVINLSDHLSGQVVAPSDGNFVPNVWEQDPGNPTTQIAIIASGNSSGGGVIHSVGPPPPPPPPDPHRTVDPTFVQFGGPEIPAIPAGFFDPGSNPFLGTIALRGASQDSSDTVVQRAGALDLMSPANSIPLELVALNLVSVAPITVTGAGGPTQWTLTVEIDRELYPDAWVGQLDTMMSGPNGGTFNAVIPFQPKLTFTDVADPARVRILELNQFAPLQLTFTNVPFVVNLAPHLEGVISAPSDGNFVPGVWEQIPGQPPTQIVVQAGGNSPGGGVLHTIGPPVGPRLIPAGQDCWETTCGQTQYDFTATPIPIGFFNVEPDDNTLSFMDVVHLEDAGSNTVVRRCADALFPTGLPASVDVPIELTSLSLRSCTPIAVQDCCKPAELWNLEVKLSPTLPPACSGAMTMTRTHDNGGTFTSQFPVQALFRFTRINPPTVTYEFDTALAGYPPELMTSGQPFDFVQRLYDPDTARVCGVNFVPGVEEYVARNPTGQYPQCCTPPRCHQFLGGSLHCTAPPDCSKCPGACCNPTTGVCSHVTAEACASVAGLFKGIRSKCEDTDADGIADDFETGTCCGPRDACNSGTDPANPDSDGDGVLDGVELSNGFDACDPCDPNPGSPACPPGGTDCNGNSNLDICDIAAGTSADCDENNIPDECQPDCDFDACADACEIICGTQSDSNSNGVPDDCEGSVPSPVADPTGLTKTRFVSFSVPASQVAAGPGTALRIRLVSLHHVVPPYSGGPSIPFTSFEGQVRWVGPPTQYSESSSSAVLFHASSLQCAPHYQVWSTVGLLHVTGSAIVPSSIYEIENLAASCMGVEDTCTDVSAPLTTSTTRWGDVTSPYNPPSPTVQPDIGDIGALVNKFRSAPGAPIKARALLAGAPGNPFGEITVPVLSVDLGFSHISACVDAFRGLAYPYTISSCP